MPCPRLTRREATRLEGFLLVLGPAALAASSIASRMVSAKSESPLRWAVLFFACLTLLGNYTTDCTVMTTRPR